MKRRLIDYDVFERMEKDSLSNARLELTEAGPVLSKALNLECDVKLHCFGAEDVLFEAEDGSYVHANYRIQNGHIELDNVEQLVINEETEEAKSREVLTQMVESLIENEEKKAEALFEKFLDFPFTRRNFLTEEKKWRVVPIRKDGEIKGYKKAKWQTTPKSRESSSDTTKRMRSKIKKTKRTPDSAKKLRSVRRSKVSRTISDWANLCENVFDYVDYKELGPTLKASTAHKDDGGNVVSIRIPSKETRNEAKMLNFKWKLVEDVAGESRRKAKDMVHEQEFCKAINELKRQNNLSDNEALAETLENIVSKWPGVLYLTEGELAKTIKDALDTMSAKNFDDQTCFFMAEAILRNAHDAYTDRVSKILRISGTQVTEDVDDAYSVFKQSVNEFYPRLDETDSLEMQVFVDLYEAIRQVHELASDEENHILRSEAAGHLNDLVPIIQQEIEPNLEVAADAADWLMDLVETNLETQAWNVSNDTHVTVSGDHPDMAKKAGQGYSPKGDFTGDWGDSAPVSDGKSYRGGLADEMRNRSYGQEGGSDVFPTLNNPYVPSPYGDYKIKGEKHVDADSNLLANWGNDSTWPNLQNPYVPNSETPASYQMNKGKEEDLVVDK